MQRTVLSSLFALGVLMTPVLSLVAQEGTEIHGNVKAGILLDAELRNSYGPAKASYVIDNTLVGKLGTENGNGFGVDVVQNFPGLDGTWAKAHVTLEGWYMDFASSSYTANTPVNRLADGSVAGYRPYLAQAFVEMGGFAFDPRTTLWAGTRYYAGDGIPISGFNWVDRSGAGLGAQGLGGGQLDLAVLTGSSLLAGKESVPVTLQAKVRLGERLSLEGAAAWSPGSETVAAQSSAGTSGYEGLATLDLDTFYGLPGTSKLVVQVGTGMFGNAEKAGAPLWSQLGKVGTLWTYQKSLSARLVTFGLANFGDFDVMSAVWAEYDTQSAVKNTDGTVADPRLTLSAVVRPVWKADRNFTVALEAGVAEKRGGLYGTAADGSGDKAAGLVSKVTLSPAITLDSGFWTPTHIRLLASWQSQDARLGPLGADGRSSGLWFGIQTEARW